MADLKEQLDRLRHQLETLPASATASEIAQLEGEARALLAQSKNTAYEADARELFAQLAQRSAPATPEAAAVRGLLRRARIRIEIAGDEDDVDEAIDILAEALDQDPNNPEVHELLLQAAHRSPHLEMKVRGLMDRYGLEMEKKAAPRAAAPPVPPQEREKPVERVAPSSPVSPEQVNALLSDVSQAYYSGDYQRAVDLANRVLADDPDNSQAKDYRQKAEDNLLRGVVPDHRIPFDARIAYNRANSLVRAGNYDEAERLYREARDLAARAGIGSWKDVEQALLDIQDLALARELLAEGDRLLAADDWDNALQKYEGAMRVVPNDPLAQERIDLVRNVRQQFDQATVQLNMTTGSLNERARELQRLINTLAGLQQLLPGSERIKRLVREIDERIDHIIGQLYNQAQGALTRMESASVLDERLRLTTEAVRALEVAAELDPANLDINSLLQRARQSEADMAEARHVIERASALIAQNYENELSQARTMLAGLRGYAQDPRYRMIVADLLARHLERAEAALDNHDPQGAQRWLDIAKEEPFRILGRRTDILRLEEEVRQMRRRQYGVWTISGLVIIIILAAVAFATKSTWEPIINPPTDTPTLTPSITPTSTATTTPTATPTETLTPTPSYTPSLSPTPTWTYTPSYTPTHTWTPTPSDTPTHTWTPSITPTSSYTPEPTSTPTLTWTPSITPTPSVLCYVYADREAVNVRAQPNPAGILIYTISLGQSMDVMAQQIGTDNQRWFQVRFEVETALITGWVRADLVKEFGGSHCPPLG
jgi:tetratricopeptide (TPR) repeat protein